MSMIQQIPIVETLRTYRKGLFQNDLVAGLTVAVMLIPQGMAYAVLAGMPPVYGLYASVVPLLIYAVLGSSRQLAVGPVAMVSLLVVAGVGEIAEPGSSYFIQLVILTAFGVGIFQLAMGVFRLGFLVNFLSHPVLSGFTSAAAIIIGVSQLPALLGLQMERGEGAMHVLIEAGRRITEVDPVTALIGFGAVALLAGARRWNRAFPSALLVVVLGTVVSWSAGLAQGGLAIVGEVPSGLPSIQGDLIQPDALIQLLPLITVISLVSYMESIAVAKAIATRRGYEVNPNQELIALGASNVGGAFFQSIPVTGGFSRSAVNDQAGAKTTIASVITAVTILLTLLFLTDLFYYLPRAVLSAIIIVAVAGLFDAHEMKTLWKRDRKDLAMLLITFVVTLGMGIEQGILTGVLLSLGMVIYSSTRPHQAELGQLGESSNYRNIDRYKDAKTDPETLIYRFDSALYFANVSHFQETLKERMNRHGEALRQVVLDASTIHAIDSTGIHQLEQLMGELQERGIRLLIAGAIGPVRDKLKQAGMMDKLGEDAFYFDVYEAVISRQALERGESPDRSHDPCQSDIPAF
ncbi:MAG: SulP family inorganic anion transporter [Bacteroidota bacterium]